MHQLSIIVPTVNESRSIGELVGRIFPLESLRKMKPEVVVVDDASSDGTQEEVRRLMLDYPVRLISRDNTSGLASAVLEGANAAVAPVVVVMDADLSHDPGAIPRLAAPVLNGEQDMIIGSRYVPGGEVAGWPWIRRLISRAATLPARWLTEVDDPLSGFFAIRRELLLQLNTQVPGFKICLELLAHFGEDLKVEERPITFQDRRFGQSKLTASVGLAYLKQLLGYTGARLSGSNGFRFAVVGLCGFFVDLALFQALLAAGFGIGPSHIISFCAAVCFNFIFNAHWSFADQAKQDGAVNLKSGALYVCVAILALFFRGGILGFLTQVQNWPPWFALSAAIGGAALVNYLGCAFFVFPEKHAGANQAISWRMRILLIVGYAFVLRLVYIGLPELLQEEAYYWNYAQHPAAGYLDHPPMVALLIGLGNVYFGHTE